MRVQLPPALYRRIVFLSSSTPGPASGSVAACITACRSISSFYSRGPRPAYSSNYRLPPAARHSGPSHPPIVVSEPTVPASQLSPAVDALQADAASSSSSSSDFAVNPFARLSSPPSLSELLHTAVKRATKHRISSTLRSSSPSPSRAAVSSSSRRRSARTASSSTASVVRNTWKIRSLAAAQLLAIHDSIALPLSRCISAFPSLSQLHPFDRAVMRLSLPGGQKQYVEVLREMRRLMGRLQAAHDAAGRELADAHIRRLPPPPATALPAMPSAESSQPPQEPASRDLDSLLCCHRQRLLRTALAASASLASFASLTAALSHLPIIERRPSSCLTVLIVGMPNVGKSSLLRAVSSGRPEVQNYSFTTRGLVVGHMLMTEEDEEHEEAAESAEGSAVREEKQQQREAERKRLAISSARRRGFARASDDEEQQAVRLHAHRSAAREQRRVEQQQQRQRSDLLSSVSSLSPSLRVQLIDTPGLLFRPDSHRKSIELLTLTALHFLPLQLVLFVTDCTGGCGWSLEEQRGLRRELRQRYSGRLSSGEVGWIDVGSKSDVTERVTARAEPAAEDEAGLGDEEKARRRREQEEHCRLYAGDGEDEAEEPLPPLSVSVEVEDGSVQRLRRGITAELRRQLQRLRRETGEPEYESVEQEIRRTFGMTAAADGGAEPQRRLQAVDASGTRAVLSDGHHTVAVSGV